MFELSHNKLNFQTVQPNTISNLLKSCNVNKAAGIDNISGRFLLGIPITQICNLSIKLSHFSGFRKNHSTNTSLSYLTNKILTGFGSGLLTGMILIDLQKAFATINHNILLRKVASLGFSNHLIKWFQSYLSDRSFRVNIKNKYSSTAKIECGVPQGSILGPLLFLLYVK